MTKIDDMPDAQVVTLAARKYLKEEKRSRPADQKLAYLMIGFVTAAGLLLFFEVLK